MAIFGAYCSPLVLEITNPVCPLKIILMVHCSISIDMIDLWQIIRTNAVKCDANKAGDFKSLTAAIAVRNASIAVSILANQRTTDHFPIYMSEPTETGNFVIRQARSGSPFFIWEVHCLSSWESDGHGINFLAHMTKRIVLIVLTRPGGAIQ